MTVTAVGQPVAAIKSATASASFTSFTPNAGSSYVIGVSVGTDGSGTAASITGIAWATGGSWTRLGFVQANAFQPEASIWISTAPGTGAITITGNAHVTSVFASVVEITGDNKASPGGASASAANTGNLNTLTVVPNSTGGWIFYVAIDTFEGFTVTPNGASTALDSWNNAGAESYGLQSNAATVAAVNYTIGVTNTVTDNNHIAFEIVPGAAVGAVAGPLPFPPFGPMFHDPYATPFQLLGDQSSPTAVSLSDTASGTDALTVSAAVPLADTGTGTDPMAVAAAIPLADTGAGADTLAAAVSVPLTDTGAGADASTVTAAVPLADTSTGVDTLGLTTDGPVAGPQFAAMFLQPSAASFQMLGDTTTTTASVNLPDTGTGADDLAATASVALSDTAVGAEGFTVTVTFTVTDVGTGTDVLTGTAAIPLTDSGAGGDVLTATAAVPLTDVGAGLDALTVSGSNNPNLPDTAAGADTLAVSTAVSLSDTATGTDQATATAAVPLSDVGTAADSLTISVTSSGPITGPILVPPFGPPFAIRWVVPFQLQGGGGPLASIPVTVTGTDRPTSVVSSTDRPSASVTGTDGPTVTITSG